MMSFQRFIRISLLFFSVSVLCSAVALPIVQQHKRDRLNEWYRQISIHDKAQAEWGRLLLEQAVLSAPSRIEPLAQVQLQMHMPRHDQVRGLMP